MKILHLPVERHEVLMVSISQVQSRIVNSIPPEGQPQRKFGRNVIEVLMQDIRDRESLNSISTRMVFKL